MTVDLEQENAVLRARIMELENQLNFLRTHGTVAAGIAGERLIASTIGGSLTRYDEGFDIVTSDNVSIEVKASKPSRSAKDYSSTRWQWGKVLGETGKKVYDFILLVGEAESKYMPLYKDPSSPFVFFLLPFCDVEEMSMFDGRSGRIMRLSTNPNGLRTTSGKRMFDIYQTTIEELQSRFHLSNAAIAD